MSAILKFLPNLKFNKNLKSKRNTKSSKATINCPIALQWIISEERLKALKEKQNEFLESEIFDGCGFKYSLTIYPNGDGKTKIGQTRIFLRLYLQQNAKKIDAEFCLTIESAKYSNKMNHTFDKSKGWGIKCCSTEKLFDSKRKFIVDGILTIRVEGVLKVTKLMKDEEESAWNSRDFAVCLWNRETTKDFSIFVENAEIKVHKIVLSTRSPVFEAMFESNMKEAKENQMFITDFSHEIVEAAIKLCYHQNLTPSTLSVDNKMLLLLFFDKYDIQHPKEYIENLLIKEITSLNVCKLSNCAVVTNAKNLRQHCSNFLQQCLKAFVPISDFDNLDKDFAVHLLKNSFHHVSKTI